MARLKFSLTSHKSLPMLITTNEISPTTVASIRSLLDALYTRIPLKLWMVTTVHNDEWTIVYTHNKGYAVEEGDVLPWRESFCCRMIKGEGPQFASRSDDCAAYVNAPIGSKVPIKAYIGVPLVDDQNQVMGTLCGIDPEPDVTGIQAGEALVRQTAALISRLIQMEMQVALQRKLANSWSNLALHDALTGLLNRRGWDALIHTATSTAKTNDILGVMVIDLNGLKLINDSQGHAKGDTILQKVASVLTESMRGQDAVARLGGDEFGLLLRCTDQQHIAQVVSRIVGAFEANNISAEIGYATTPPLPDLDSAYQDADLQMLKAKHQRRQQIAA
jgi:diguanylate cyclase (GGDEF)-like protein